MADENNTGSTTETAAMDAPIAPSPKKQRAPRKSKVQLEAVPVDPAVAMKSTRTYRKKGSELAADAKPALSKADTAGKNSVKTGGKNVGGRKPVSGPKPKSTTPITAIFEMSDLVKLEEENKTLRKALADKLRAENADLRKRLGTN